MVNGRVKQSDLEEVRVVGGLVDKHVMAVHMVAN